MAKIHFNGGFTFNPLRPLEFEKTTFSTTKTYRAKLDSAFLISSTKEMIEKVCK